MGANESRNLWISIGSGLFATFMLYSYTQEKKSELDRKVGDKISVVIARQDINEMETIYEDKLEVVERIKTEAEPDYFKSTEDIVGTVAAIPIKKGQTVTKTKVTEVGTETGMAIQVPIDRRAVTIPVGPQNSNAGLIRPGDRVDIFAVLETGKGANQKREALLFRENVGVIATGFSMTNSLPRTIEKDPSGTRLVQTTLTGDSRYSNITVEVEVTDAQDLIFLVATNPSSLYLLLRNPNDKKSIRGSRNMASSNSDSIIYSRTGQNGGQTNGQSNSQTGGFSPQGQPNLNNGPRTPGN